MINLLLKFIEKIWSLSFNNITLSIELVEYIVVSFAFVCEFYQFQINNMFLFL